MLNDEHPELAALMYSPLVLMPINSANDTYTHQQLLSVQQTSATEWILNSQNKK